jgi:hypothetical protein
VLALFREDELAVGEDVELPLPAFADSGWVLRLPFDLRRETRGARVIAVSDGAVMDLDGHSTHRTQGTDGLRAARRSDLV